MICLFDAHSSELFWEEIGSDEEDIGEKEMIDIGVSMWDGEVVNSSNWTAIVFIVFPFVGVVAVFDGGWGVDWEIGVELECYDGGSVLFENLIGNPKVVAVNINAEEIEIFRYFFFVECLDDICWGHHGVSDHRISWWTVEVVTTLEQYTVPAFEGSKIITVICETASSDFYEEFVSNAY